MDERMSLEPCPFCGATNGTTEPDRAQGDKWGYYMCECSARGPEVRTGYSESPTAAWRDEAISQWNTRHLATPAQTVDVWVSVADRMPDRGVPVIAYFTNSLGNGRRIRAAYCEAKTLEADLDSDFGEYDEETDTYWCPEGWYEYNENEETHWTVDDPVTHWTPLPEPPLLTAVLPKEST